jgi:mono/diheme cytochrome c family protein
MTGMRAHGLYLVTVLAGAAVVGGAGCGNPVPDRPSYERDIKPLMEAHCIRCHGAGGTLNADPDIRPVSGVQKPNATDFTSLNGLMPLTGAAEPALELFVKTLPMPPPPSDLLTNYERELLFTWAKNPLP